MDTAEINSPWKSVRTQAHVDLREVMSEQLAADLQEKEYSATGWGKAEADANRTENSGENIAIENTETMDDLLIAQQLQLEFDLENDRILKRLEARHNANSKVKISYEKYRTVEDAMESSSSSDESEGASDDERPAPQRFSQRGYRKLGDSIVTKHDAAISYERNANQMVDTFPLCVHTGYHKEPTGADIKLNNRVMNELKAWSQEESKRTARLHEKKEHSTAEMAVDAKSRISLYKLVNSGYLNSIGGVISTGKESVVLHALRNMENCVAEGQPDLSDYCALKVFKTTLSDFHTREQYIRGDYRFIKTESKRCNVRKLIRLWAEKEISNLKRMYFCGIPCPYPFMLRKHIVVMSLIGAAGASAPKLKDAALDADDVALAYRQCTQIMHDLHHKCHLVHADLSEYNILWHDRHCYLIDVSQAVDTTHPKAFEFLLRDCRNVNSFFAKAGVAVLGNQELLLQITEWAMSTEASDAEFLRAIEQRQPMARPTGHCVPRPADEAAETGGAEPSAATAAC